MAEDIDVLLREGRHADAAERCLAEGDPSRAASLYAEIWAWAKAIDIAREAGLLDEAYGHALHGQDRKAAQELLPSLEKHPELARRAAEHAQDRGRLLDAARLRAAAGETELAAELYEAAGEFLEAAQAREQLGQNRQAGILLEKRLRQSPEDAKSALALGRILAQFGRFEHAVRALQKAAREPDHEPSALKLLVACFAAMGMGQAAGSALDRLRLGAPGLPPSVSAFLLESFGDERGLAAFASAGQEALLAGRYRVLKPLGAGATGRVVLAHDAFHDRSVAIKVLNVSGGAAGRDAFVRFSREATVASGVSHPHVVRVHEFNPDGPFLVMEYMAGGTLEERLKDEAGHACVYDPLQTQVMLSAVLSALEALHRRGVVHRDLKPPNIFFSEGGDVKLGDFGVAHLADLGATLTGALMGTLAFMAPEQITANERPTAATDIYALGVILFRCLTGRLPFEGPDFVMQHLEQPPPRPTSVAPWLPTEFDDLILAMLDKDPAGRPSSATELRDRLSTLPWRKVGEAVLVASVPPPERPSAPLWAEDSSRYRPLRTIGASVELIHDKLLNRHIERHSCDSERLDQLRSWAAADGPHLQAIYELDRVGCSALLEHPTGISLRDRGPAEGLTPVEYAQLQGAVRELHAAGLSHAQIDYNHIVVGPDRLCLRLPDDLQSTDRERDLHALKSLYPA